MKIKYSVFLIVLSFFAFLPYSCKKKKKEVEYNRLIMLHNIGTNIIVPSYQELTIKTNALKNATEEFTTNPNLTTLTDLQYAWKAATTAWKSCETYTFGFADEYSLASEIDAWPTNPTIIDSEISGSMAITEAYINTTGTTRKGFPALEYLLFSTSGNTVILDNFTTQPNFDRRKAYALALAADIKTKTANCYASWNPNEGNYIQSFITNASNDGGSSVSILLNAMIQNLEVIKNNKIGYPLGKNTNGILHPELVEASLSEMSLAHIQSNLTTLENLYLGKANGTNDQGYDDYLDYVNAEFDDKPLANKITEQFTACQNAIDAITPPLQSSVASETTKCETAYLELKKLVVLMKLDMSSQLGIVISFSDNDGD